VKKYNLPGSDYFFRFQKYMVHRISWPYSPEQDSIFQWRAQFLFAILSVGLILGFFTLIAAANLILKEGTWGLAVVDILGLFLGIGLFFIHRIRFEIRALIICLTCYLIGTAVILSVGPLSGGPIWLFSFSVLAGALLGNWAAFAAIVMNTVSLIIIGLLISTGKIGSDFPLFTTPQAMITAGASFFLLNTVTSISLSALLKGLNQSEKRYRLIAENVSDVIWTMDMDFKFTYISPSIHQQRGYTVKEAMAQRLDEALLPDSLEKSLNLIAEKLKLIEQGDPEGWQPTIFETEQYCKDGAVIWTRNNARILPGPDQKPKSILGVAVNITERKQSEEKLRQSEEKFRIAFKTSPSVITLTSVEDGVYVDVNDAFTKLLGYSAKEIIGQSSLVFNIWNHTKDRDFLISKLKKEGIVESLEAEFKGKNGQIITGLMSARTLEIENKTYLLASTQDITELRKNEKVRLNLESRLQHAQKMESIGTLAGGIAHDFNNILFPIMGHTEMLLADASEDSAFRDRLNKIYAGTLRARDLVKQILTFSRQESSELKLIRLQTVVKEALQLIRSTIPSNIIIRQDLQADCGPVKANPTQIHQIVMNLTTNAYHAMQDTGNELNVSLKEIELREADLMSPDINPGFYALLSVSDKGAGMNNEVMKRIFDPFFTTKEIGKGTGMGLSIVHGIVKSMKGAIQVFSEPGKGTEFSVYFPVEKESLVTNKIKTKALSQGGTEQILLIDDEEGILEMEETILTRLGYRVTSYVSSIAALEAFRSTPSKFDLVITDMAMPDMPGDKLSGEMIQIRPDIPVLLCTGFSETMSEEKAASLGIKGFLMKPVLMADFAQKIRDILDKQGK
jgi:PAS domain S-box-containing protein